MFDHETFITIHLVVFFYATFAYLSEHATYKTNTTTHQWRRFMRNLLYLNCCSAAASSSFQSCKLYAGCIQFVSWEQSMLPVRNWLNKRTIKASLENCISQRLAAGLMTLLVLVVFPGLLTEGRKTPPANPESDRTQRPTRQPSTMFCTLWTSAT